MSYEPSRARSQTRTQLICIWSGPIFVLVFLTGLIVAGFVPPPAPGQDAATLADRLHEDKTRIQVGLILALASSGLYAFFTAGVSVQLKRIEGSHSPMTYAQLGLGVLAVLLIIFPLLWLLTAVYRSGRDDQLVLLLSDMAWFPFVGAWMTVVFQWIATAIAILSDDSDAPVFPRWTAYFNIWVAIQSIPSTLLFVTDSGPFTWRGIFSFWFALTAFAGWILVMTVLLRRAVRAEPSLRQWPSRAA